MRLDRHNVAMTREVLKIVVIVIYLIFATTILIANGNPIGFAPLLPWALWSVGAGNVPRIRR